MLNYKLDLNFKEITFALLALKRISAKEKQNANFYEGLIEKIKTQVDKQRDEKE